MFECSGLAIGAISIKTFPLSFQFPPKTNIDLTHQTKLHCFCRESVTGPPDHDNYTISQLVGSLRVVQPFTYIAWFRDCLDLRRLMGEIGRGTWVAVCLAYWKGFRCARVDPAPNGPSTLPNKMISVLSLYWSLYRVFFFHWFPKKVQVSGLVPPKINEYKKTWLNHGRLAVRVILILQKFEILNFAWCQIVLICSLISELFLF